jgi:hypothetical protein
VDWSAMDRVVAGRWDRALVYVGVGGKPPRRLVHDAHVAPARCAPARLGSRGRAGEQHTMHLLDHGAEPDWCASDFRRSVRGAFLRERVMKITIELEGKAVQVIDVPSPGAAGAPAAAEPPPELLAAARALGAYSAGPAAFSLPPGASVPPSTIDATEQSALPDLDAGRAAGAATGSKRPAKKAGETAARRRK